MDSLEMVKVVSKALESKKGEDIKILKVKDITTIADYFIIVCANNNTQVKALADEVEYKLKQNNIFADHIEGRQSNDWILLDYKNVIVHVFLKSSREFYNLDELWSKGEEINI